MLVSARAKEQRKKRNKDVRKSGKKMKDVRKFILVKTDMSISSLEIADDKLLDTSYELLDCECVEFVSVLFTNCLIIDDSGKLKEKKVNPICSMLYAGVINN